jgi:hypothetical protein
MALVLGLTAVSFAGQNFFGQTGLLTVPTALVAPDKAVLANYYRVPLFDLYGATFGFEGKYELTYTRFDFGLDGRNVLSAKAVLPIQDKAGAELLPFQLAVGMTDISDEFSRSMYVAGTYIYKSSAGGLAPGINLSAGIGDGMYDALFAGGEVIWDFGLQAVAEWDSKNWNWGVRYTHPDLPALTLSLGWFDTDEEAWGVTYDMNF